MGNVGGALVGLAVAGPVGFVVGGAAGMGAEIAYHENSSSSVTSHQPKGLKRFSVVRTETGSDCDRRLRRTLKSIGLSVQETDDMYDRIELLCDSGFGDDTYVHKIFEKGRGTVIHVKAVKDRELFWVAQKIKFAVHDRKTTRTTSEPGFSVIFPVGGGKKSYVSYRPGILKAEANEELCRRMNEEMSKVFRTNILCY